MVPHARRRLRREDVAGRGGEELQHRRLLERRRVRHVDDHLGVRERVGQAFAGEGVDSRAG
jgi:hypothetical protein